MFALTLAFAFMAGAFIWLSTTVDGRLHDRSQAAAVAFQAARSAAQQIDETAARDGRLVIDPARATAAARAAAARLLSGAGDSGSVTSVRINGTEVTVSVVITTHGTAEQGSASATAKIGFDHAD